MRQTLSARVPDLESEPRQTGLGARADAESYESLIAATTASEKRAIETAAKTAQALDSVASWIEQAQSRFSETARAASEAQAQTTHVVNDALGSLSQKLVELEKKVETAGPSSVAEALKRIESRLNLETAEPRSPAPPAAAGGALNDALRGFEERIAGLTERLAANTPRPIGRRGLRPDDEIKTAVAEIRQRQAELDQAPAAAATAGPMAPALDRNHAGILLSLRSDIAKLSTQLETVRGPSQAAIDQLNREMGELRGSVGSLATRDDLSSIERSLAELAGQVAEARSMGRGVGQIRDDIEALHGTLRGLAETRTASGTAAFDRDIEALSAKLDAMGQAGDPALRQSLLDQLHEIRTSVGQLAAPGEIAALSQTVSELRDEVAGLSLRQANPRDMAELKASVADVQRMLSASPTGVPGTGAEIVNGLRPVETLLHALVDKLDNVERQVAERTSADPASLDALERHIADLATRFSVGAGRDPAIAHLESAMSGLMGEIATWREDAFEAAERAARKAVSETLASAPAAAPPAFEREVAELRQRYDASEKRTAESLAAVNLTLETVAARISGLNLASTPAGQALREAVAPAEPAAAKPAPEPRRRAEPRLEAMLAEAERPVPPAEEEILLEPGSARPKAGKAAADLDVDSADIKSSFIAAARRAAQAAAADAAATKGRAGKPIADSAALGQDAGSSVVARLRALIDKRRRPLLLSAAALILALGAFQILAPGTAAPPAKVQAKVEQRVAPAPVPAQPATAGAAADPVTTQSISPRTPPIDSAMVPATRPDLSVLPAPAAVPAAAPAASASLSPITPLASPVDVKPASPAPEPVAMPAGLKQAALAGNPVAAYEYASRAAEGRGVPKDPQLALKLYEKAAEKGLAPAQYRLGNLYEKGLGTARDLEAAKGWYRKAAEGGNARAMHNLAVLLAEGSGGKPDYLTAVSWFSRAAEHGVRDSQFNLAVLYARGLGTVQDLSRSYLWFSVAAASGDADAAKKRDEVASRLSPADLASAKAAAAQWHMTPPAAAANEVTPPANGWADTKATASTAQVTRKAGENRV